MSADPLEWNDARGALMRDARVAMAVVPAVPDAVPQESWIDMSRMYVVRGPVAPGPSLERLKPLPSGLIAVPHGDVG